LLNWAPSLTPSIIGRAYLYTPTPLESGRLSCEGV